MKNHSCEQKYSDYKHVVSFHNEKSIQDIHASFIYAVCFYYLYNKMLAKNINTQAIILLNILPMRAQYVVLNTLILRKKYQLPI